TMNQSDYIISQLCEFFQLPSLIKLEITEELGRLTISFEGENLGSENFGSLIRVLDDGRLFSYCSSYDGRYDIVFIVGRMFDISQTRAVRYEAFDLARSNAEKIL